MTFEAHIATTTQTILITAISSCQLHCIETIKKKECVVFFPSFLLSLSQTTLGTFHRGISLVQSSIQVVRFVYCSLAF